MKLKENRNMWKRCLRGLGAALLIAVSFVQQASAQDYVGVLPELLKPEVSQKLGLIDEQRSQIQEVMRARMSAVIGLGKELREAPADEHDRLRSEFSSEWEEMGFELLDPEQQNLLAKYRVQWMGML